MYIYIYIYIRLHQAIIRPFSACIQSNMTMCGEQPYSVAGTYVINAGTAKK